MKTKEFAEESIPESTKAIKKRNKEKGEILEKTHMVESFVSEREGEEKFVCYRNGVFTERKESEKSTNKNGKRE